MCGLVGTVEVKGYTAVGEGRAILPCQGGSRVSCPQTPSPRGLERHQPLPHPRPASECRGAPRAGLCLSQLRSSEGGGLLLVILVLEARRPRI